MARIALTKVGCQDQIVAAFFQRTFGNVQEARFVGLAASPESFGDISRDGNGGAPQLQRQPVGFRFWEGRSERIRSQHELMCFAPNQ